MDFKDNGVRRNMLDFLLKSKAMVYGFYRQWRQRNVLDFLLKSKAIVYRFYRKWSARKRSSLSTQK